VKVFLTPAAKEDLRDIQKYIYKNNPKAAKKVSLHIIDRIQTLLPTNPGIGRLTGVLRTKELVINKYPYIVPYRVQENEIHILRVLHTSRKWEF